MRSGLVDGYGRPASASDGSKMPEVHRAPPPLISGRFTQKAQFEEV